MQRFRYRAWGALFDTVESDELPDTSSEVFTAPGQCLAKTSITWHSAIFPFEQARSVRVQLGAQRCEAPDLSIDTGDVRFGDRIDLRAGSLWIRRQLQKAADVPDFEAEIARVTDEQETVQMRLSIASLPPLRTRWRRH